MLKGINQWCYPAGTSLEKVFSYSKEANFDAVELNLYGDEDIGLTMSTTNQEAESILKLARSYDLELYSLSTSLLWEAPLSSNDESVRERGRNIVKKQIDLANLMGMNTILVVPGLVNEWTSYDDCYTNSQYEIKRLAEYAEVKGVHLGIENVWNKFLLSPLEMKRFVDDVGSNYVGVYFDVGNVLQFGYPEQWIKILGNQIRKVHVKDYSLKIGNISGFGALFSGDVNWKSVMKALRDIGYDDVITSEITPYDIAPNQLAMDTSRHMDVLFSSGRNAQKTK